jgi:positive phototaxis protein PixI
MEWCSPDGIQSPPSAPVTPELAPFLRGYWVKSSGEMLAVLDGTAITEAMPKTQ